MTKIRPSGGYRDTASFQTATIVYDATYWFCEKFLDPHSRTVDPMVQAARSGRQNIAEGSRAAARLAERQRRQHDPSNPSDRSDQIPSCPKCNKPMVLRTAQKGRNAGKQFWGSSNYPGCRGVVEN